MIIEELKPPENTNTQNLFSIPKGTSSNRYVFTMEQSVKYFLMALKGHPNKNELNEDKYTQEFIVQLGKLLNQFGYPFLVNAQYVDAHNKTKGIPDFFFYETNELGKSNPALFVVEAKRLPSKTFKTEYVIGDTNNGGIERFKIEKHGFGLSECGMLGFIEDKGFPYWLNEVNSWISNLAKITNDWKIDERLTQKKTTIYRYYTSAVHAKKQDKLLHHIWIKV